MKTKNLINIIILFFFIGIFIIAIKNFSTPYFNLNDHIYVKKSSDSNETKYYSIRAKKSIKVSEKEGYKEINIDGEKYRIFGQPNDFFAEDENSMVKIEYPDGTVNEGWYQKGIGLYKRNENGEIDLNGIVKINVGNEQLKIKDNELTDRKLMTIAFESMQDKKGVSEMFWLGVLFSIIGIIQFKFPTLGFSLRHSLWVKDPEPTEAYIATSKIGGVILCVFGISMLIYGAGILKF